MRGLCLFLSEPPIPPRQERTPTIGHGGQTVRREQYLLTDILDCMERAWPGGPAQKVKSRWIQQNNRPAELKHLVSKMRRQKRDEQPLLVDAHGAVAVVEYLCNKKDTAEARKFLDDFRAAWGWVRLASCRRGRTGHIGGGIGFA